VNGRIGALDLSEGSAVKACIVICVVLVGVLLGGDTGAFAGPQSCPNSVFRVGPSASLPDCRAFEQVSPVDKAGFAAYPPAATSVQAAPSGDAVAWLSYQAFPGAVGNTALSAAHVARREANGWQTADWTPDVPKAEVLKLYVVGYVISPDLSQAVLQVPLIPLVAGATPHVQNLFLRDPQGTYSLITTAPPLVSPEEICGPGLLSLCWQFADLSAFAGSSNDFSHVLFESNAQLTNNAPETFIESLYESVNGAVRLVGILPDGSPAATSTAGAGSSSSYENGSQTVDLNVERAVSPTASHVVFQAPADGGQPDPAQNGQTEVYDRIGGTETIEISAPASEAPPAVTTAEPATFQTASVDGSRVFFTSSAELTTASNTGPANNSEDLYEYDLATKQLADLTVDTSPGDVSTGAMTQGVVGTSSDGSYVYYVANGQLIEGKGVDGQPNLYMVHNGNKPVFIATLNSGGQCRFTADSCDWSPFPVVREAYVAPDGQHLAFMSSRSLSTINFPTGYDNIDQETGVADSEVYEYTAPGRTEGSGQLVCASCDPSGYQPVGNALLGGISPTGDRQQGKPTYVGIGTPFDQVRPLSEDGKRLFYAAPASLAAPYDSVYEYEHTDEGTCVKPSGCHNLISSPEITGADYFLGSSADGSDIFLATSAQLAQTDIDELPDVYDARLDGGFSTPPVRQPCENACQQRKVTPAAASPESLTSEPSENLHPSPPVKPTCIKKGFRISHGKCVKVKRRRIKHRKSKVKGSRESRRTNS
jgi:hypothetical protein